MGNPQQTRVFGFWDGDYTFHVVQYADSSKNFTFRVRIDNHSPEERMRENEHNHNRAPPRWLRTRKATSVEIGQWVTLLGERFPLRSGLETRMLRNLKLGGPTNGMHLDSDSQRTLTSLTDPRPCVRGFQRVALTCVRCENGVYSLTADGNWLTCLMK